MVQNFLFKNSLLVIFIYFQVITFGQSTNFKSSCLPLIYINTHGKPVVDEPKIDAYMKIIDNGIGNMNSIGDTSKFKSMPIGIEYRGSTSQTIFPKKPYAIEIRDTLGNDKSVSILGMPSESDWNLITSYNEKTFIRDPFAYTIAGWLMDYAPRFRYVDLVINKNYFGTFILTEKIKRDKNRVSISKLDINVTSGDKLTGGYIIKVDKTDGANRQGWISDYKAVNSTVLYQYHYPEYSKMNLEQTEYIKNWMQVAEKEMFSIQNIDDSLKGFRKYFDEKSIMDVIIVNEVCKNVDGYRLSSYMYKDRDSINTRMKFGPVWDFNISQGNADYCNGFDYKGWSLDFKNYCSDDYFQIPFYWNKVWESGTFRKRFKKYWENLRSGQLSNAHIEKTLDSLKAIVEKPLIQNFNVWPVIGKYVWPNYYIGNSYNSETEYQKNWIFSRLSWMDSEIKFFENFIKTDEIKLYPNPSNDDFVLRIDLTFNTQFTLLIYDNLGRQVYTEKLNVPKNGYIHKFGSTLIPGMYHYALLQSDEVFQSGNMIKN